MAEMRGVTAAGLPKTVLVNNDGSVSLGSAASSVALSAGEAHIGEVAGRLTTGIATLSIVGGAYAQYDRWGVSGVTDTALLLTLRKNGSTGYLRLLRVHVNKTGLTGTLRLHFYNTLTPTTTLPADNAAFPIVYANFADRLGHHDVTLGAPGGSGSDVSHVLDKDLSMALSAAAGATGIYVAIEDRSGMTLDTPTGVKIFAAFDEN